MILVDYREDTSAGRKRGTKELLGRLQALGVPVEEAALPFGDVCIEGCGPDGKILIGIERKSLHDMLHCIEDSRYSGFQKIGMQGMYAKVYLVIEGIWGPGSPPNMVGCLIESNTDGKSWGSASHNRNPVPYAKLKRYLISIGNSGVEIFYTRNLHHTAWDVAEIYHYYQKPWDDHTSLIAVPKLKIADLRYQVPLRRKWAHCLTDVGDKLSLKAERFFPSAGKLASGDVGEWVDAGFPAARAKAVLKEIWEE